MRLAIAFATFVIAVGPGWAQSGGEASSYHVDPMKERGLSYLDRLSRTKPFVSVIEVSPPDYCALPPCSPGAKFIVYNPDGSHGQDVTVECSALDKSGAITARATAEPQLAPEQSAMSGVAFRGADFDRFVRVECKVLSTTPNDLRR